MEKNSVTVWQTGVLANKYLKGVRGAIPLAQEQIQVMLRLIRRSKPDLKTVLDLGCGDGILGQAVLDQHSTAKGVFLDFSEPMLEAAWERLSDYLHVRFILADYGEVGWQDNLLEVSKDESPSNGCQPESMSDPSPTTFDAIVSGYSIHHQSDQRKRELYAEIIDLLEPGGAFINVEHVASNSVWGEEVTADHFIDALYTYHQHSDTPKTHQEVAQEFYNRPDKDSNILAPVEIQCDWLRDVGFEHVDCYFKIFELAVFGGIKPNNH